MKKKKNKSLLLDYLSEKTSLNKENILYIIDLLFKKYNITNTQSIENTLLKVYKQNSYKIGTKSINIPFVCNIKELLLLLNKNNSYVLFENINKYNYLYYSVIWESIHN